jgi:hypothetical protein
MSVTDRYGGRSGGLACFVALAGFCPVLLLLGRAGGVHAGGFKDPSE